ncbi:MAG: hypothetical protein AAF587_07035 [Bacteroidota bacterium]
MSRILVLFPYLFLQIFLTHAQTVTDGRARLSPRKKAWLISNDRGNCFEGFYSIDLSGNSKLELVSLVGEMEPYDFSKQETLWVHYYVPDTPHIYLKAEDSGGGKKYWMEVKAVETKKLSTWHKFGPWPVDRCLAKKTKQIGWLELAVLVKIGIGESHKYVPAFVRKNPTVPSFKGTYFATFRRKGKPISKYSYYLYRGKTANPSHLLCSDRLSESGSLFDIELPCINGNGTSETSFVGGWYTLLIQEEREEQEKPLAPLSFSFFHYGK